MINFKKKLLKYRGHFFWPLFAIAFFAALFTELWSGNSETISFYDAACIFEDELPGCLESNDSWKNGLAFYDSSIKVSGDTLESLKKLLWKFWQIEFAGADAASAENSISALKVLSTKKSGCMGLSWLAMIVAESRQIPLDVVLLPGHVFLRYKADSNFINLEPNKNGFSYTNEEYKEKYKKGIWTGLEFKSLNATQFLGLAAFNRGNLYLDNDLKKALTWYRMAETFFSEYPGIKVNQKIAKSRLPNHL